MLRISVLGPCLRYDSSTTPQVKPYPLSATTPHAKHDTVYWLPAELDAEDDDYQGDSGTMYDIGDIAEVGGVITLAVGLYGLAQGLAWSIIEKLLLDDGSRLVFEL